MKNKKLIRGLLLVVIQIFLITLVWFGWLVKDKIFPEKPVHFHAGFIVVKNNKQEDFTDSKYMSIKPCTLATNDIPEEETKESEQLEKAHLHDKVGDVVHVEHKGARWKDLFMNINYGLNFSEAEAYINGKKVTQFQDRLIGAYDSVVIFVGKNNDVNKSLSQAVSKKHIQEVESKSEDC